MSCACRRYFVLREGSVRFNLYLTRYGFIHASFASIFGLETTFRRIYNVTSFGMSRLNKLAKRRNVLKIQFCYKFQRISTDFIQIYFGIIHWLSSSNKKNRSNVWAISTQAKNNNEIKLREKNRANLFKIVYCLRAFTVDTSN